MNDVTERQAALWAKLTNPKEVGIYWADVAQELAPLLPDALTNPQPVLPTKPGTYSLPADDQSHMGAWHVDGLELHYLNADGNWVDVGWGNPRNNEKRAFTHLVPKRTEPSSDEIQEAWRLSHADKDIPREFDGRMLAVNAYFAGYKAGAKR